MIRVNAYQKQILPSKTPVDLLIILMRCPCLCLQYFHQRMWLFGFSLTSIVFCLFTRVWDLIADLFYIAVFTFLFAINNLWHFERFVRNQYRPGNMFIYLIYIIVYSFHFNVNYKKGALDSQPKVIKFISCLPMVSGSLRVLRLLPPLKLVAMIGEKLLKVALRHQKAIN